MNLYANKSGIYYSEKNVFVYKIVYKQYYLFLFIGSLSSSIIPLMNHKNFMYFFTFLPTMMVRLLLKIFY